MQFSRQSISPKNEVLYTFTDSKTYPYLLNVEVI